MKYLYLLFLFLVFSDSLFAQQQDPKADSLLVEYYQSQRFIEAADFLSKRYPEPVTNPKIISQLAYTANMANKLPNAEAYYQRLYSIDSTSLPVLFNMAGINARRGNSTKAISFYKRILKIDSTNFTVYKQLALLASGTGDVTNEVIYLQKANRINPQDGNVAFDLATTYSSFHLENQAEKVIDVALKADSANLLLLRGKAQVCYTQKKYPETIAVCKNLIANYDRSSQVINYKGISEFNTQQYNDCIKTFRMLDSAGIHTETSYYYLGLSYKSVKDNNKAIYYLKKAIDEGISPNVGTYYSEIGDSYDHLHLPKKAVIAYQKGLTFGEIPMTYYALASVYDSNLKDTANAIKYYKRYLHAKPPIDKQRSFVDFTTRRITDLSR